MQLRITDTGEMGVALAGVNGMALLQPHDGDPLGVDDIHRMLRELVTDCRRRAEQLATGTVDEATYRAAAAAGEV
jgi:hypothetical protein